MTTVAFTTPELGRIFLACQKCRRVMPHYRLYGRKPETAQDGRCRCGGATYTPIRLPEWQAAVWVLGVGWLWRKTIRHQQEWDPRMPVKTEHLQAEIPA